MSAPRASLVKPLPASPTRTSPCAYVLSPVPPLTSARTPSTAFEFSKSTAPQTAASPDTPVETRVWPETAVETTDRLLLTLPTVTLSTLTLNCTLEFADVATVNAPASSTPTLSSK